MKPHIILVLLNRYNPKQTLETQRRHRGGKKEIINFQTSSPRGKEDLFVRIGLE